MTTHSALPDSNANTVSQARSAAFITPSFDLEPGGKAPEAAAVSLNTILEYIPGGARTLQADLQAAMHTAGKAN